jgi:hypothetical protein
MAFAASPQHKGRADIGVTGKWQFRPRREYPHLRGILRPFWGQHKRRLSQVELSCDRLHLQCGQCGPVGHNSKRVAAELPISEHIDGNEFDLQVVHLIPVTPVSPVCPKSGHSANARVYELVYQGKPMSPLSFTDEELYSLTVLASALPPAARDGFQLVAGKLSAYPPEARGPGLVHRLAAEAQREFLSVAVGAGGKYR